MDTVPKITQKQWHEAARATPTYAAFSDVCNKAIEIALAEQSAQQETYITAEQARELGSGNAEMFVFNDWLLCGVGCAYLSNYMGEPLKYRTIKQVQPEPSMEVRISNEAALAWEKIYPKEQVDPHATLRAEYAKQVAEGTTGFYLWECKTVNRGTFESLWAPVLFTLGDATYRCTDISCYVSKDGEPAIRMLRTEAQELQAELGDTVEWKHPNTNIYAGVPLGFSVKGTYTYRTKATIKLDGKMVTPEQAKAEWEAKKETHECWYKSDGLDDFDKQSPKFCWNSHKDVYNCEYELRPKALKQVSWGDTPVGVAVRCNDTDYVWILQGVGDNKEALITVPNNKSLGMRWNYCRDLTLAPAGYQPWMYWGGGACPVPEGLKYDVTLRNGIVETNVSNWSHDSSEVPKAHQVIAYRITGIAKGYKMEGAV